MSTLVEIGKTRNCMKTLRSAGVVCPHKFSFFHTNSRFSTQILVFPISTCVDITVYQH